MKRRRKKPQTRQPAPAIRIPKPSIETFSLAGFAGMAAIEAGRKASRRRRRRR